MKDINTLIEEYFSNDNFGLEEMVKKEANEAIDHNNRLIQENRAYLDALDAIYN